MPTHVAATAMTITATGVAAGMIPEMTKIRGMPAAQAMAFAATPPSGAVHMLAQNHHCGTPSIVPSTSPKAAASRSCSARLNGGSTPP
ncbi:MAG TPA: hypothetical protein VK875_01340 [Euzebyales bacterium]|nr:hypothetical protein [Euzebyales bacterium]